MPTVAGLRHRYQVRLSAGVSLTDHFSGPGRAIGRLMCAASSSLLARWPGTHSRILSGIQRAAQTVLGVFLKRTCSRDTGASSALRVLNDYALDKSTHSLTHAQTDGQPENMSSQRRDENLLTKVWSGYFKDNLNVVDYCSF